LGEARRKGNAGFGKIRQRSGHNMVASCSQPEITWQCWEKGGNLDQQIELMAGLTLDRVLTDVEALPAEEREILENLLRQRRIESWRQETAASARKAIKAFRSGKLKSEPAESLIATLRKGK
jgi:hypothetical protein